MASVNKYIATERLRSGAQTSLCRAVRASDNKPVFLSILHRGPWFAVQKKHFDKSFEIGRSLEIPCVVRPYALEDRDEGLTLVLEDFGGVTLDYLLAESGCALAEVVRIALYATEALGNIHDRGITHKDIRPENLIYNAKTGQLKISGFGHATSLLREPPANPTRFSENHLAYISPEQTGRMNRSLDYRTDFYSLGVTVYQLLTGELPFAAGDDLEMAYSHLARKPVPPDGIDAAIPAVVSQIVMKLLAKSPEDRYQSAFGLAEDLRQCHRQLNLTAEVKNFKLGQRDRSENFYFPEKLYGRERQIDTLLQAFERTAQDRAEMMLVAGYSGVGKSALINELHKPILRQRGYFISGKCDQYKRHIPYSVLIDAFGELIRQILTETKDCIDTWRRDLEDALAPNGQVLIDVIPDLQLIVGPQPEVAQLPPGEAQNRFDMVLVSFLHVLAREEHRLVIFLDDLQWVDSSSLRLLNLLISDPDSRYFLLIGAYRDNEVDATHPLMRTIDNICSSGETVNTIHLSPLTIQDVTQICADAFGCEVLQVRPLAQLVFDKTKGNPFFLKQFLQHLAVRKAISFDFITGVWQWDTARIRDMAITDNVVELMVKRIRDLPIPTRDGLKIAACIGNRFSRETLAVVSESTPEAIGKDLWKALQEEIIVPLGPGHPDMASSSETVPVDTEYQFLHDRVQEAVYSLIPPEDRTGVHLTIGRALMHEKDEEERTSVLFDIVNHLNIGADLIDNGHERDQLVRLNLQAGRKAKTSTAYADARRFLMMGIDLLPNRSWHEKYDLTLSLYVEAVEVEYLNTNFDAAQRLSEIVVAQSRGILDQISVHFTRVSFLITQNRMVEALDAALPVLEMLGYPVYEDTAELRLHGRLPNMDDLCDIPEMTDPRQLAASQLLTIITGAAYQGKPELFAPITFTFVNLCQRNGLSTMAAYAYACYGILLCGPLNDIENGYYAGKLALKIFERFTGREYECKLHFVFDSFIRHWKEPHRDTMDAFAGTVRKGLEIGDFVYVSYTRIWSSGYLMMTGHRLAYVEEQQRQYAELMTKLKQENGLYPARIWRQLALNLLEIPDDKHSPYGESLSREDMGVIEEMNVVLTLFFVHFARLIQAYIYGDFDAALTHARAAEEYASSSISSMLSGCYCYYDALARLAAYQIMGDKARQAEMARVDSHIERMQEWRRHGPMNFRSKIALVEAEKARVEKRTDDAMRLYDDACQLAREDGFIQEAAMAAERAHDFYVQIRIEKFARIYILEAYEAYCLWGARGKAEALAVQHPRFLTPTDHEGRQKVHAADAPSQRLAGELDAMTLLKASQALSGEIESGRLLNKLLRLAVENAGARRGVLILNANGNLKVRAVITDTSDDMHFRPPVPIEEGSMLPAAMVRLVARTRETIVLGDATDNVTFAKDPYILAQKPRAALCVPICRHDKVVAVLYLENDLSANVFTTDRLTVLNVLLAQAAISLDNADLFERQRHAENSMRRLRNYLSNIINSMPSVLVGVDPDGTVTQWNTKAQQITGVSADDAVGQPLIQVFPQLAAQTEELHHASSIRDARSFSRRVRTKDSETRYEDITVYPLIANGIEGAVIRVDDVTEREQAEEALRHSERKYRSLLENIGIGVAMISPAMEILTLNRQMKEWFPGIDLSKRPVCHEAYNNPPQEEVCENCPVIKTLRDGQVHEGIIHRPSGNEINHFRIVSSPITNDDGTVVAAIEMVENITSAKQAEEAKKELERRLQRAEKMEAIGTLAGGVAHDLNNVLSGLVSYPDLILMDLPPDSPLREAILTIQESGNKAAAIVQDMLTLARRGVAVSEVINLNDVVNDYLFSPEHQRLKTFSPDIRIETDLQGSLLNILGSPVHLSKTIMNLVANAVESIHDGGVVAISTADEYIDRPVKGYDEVREGDYVVLTVADNGIGIAEDDIEKIFEPFYTKKVMGRSGTGLGMAVVWGTVKDHNGYIDVESIEGKGSKFRLFFPVTRKEADTSKTISIEEYTGNGEKILIVDDILQQREIASVLLKKLGYTVDAVPGGEEAVLYMKMNSVDLLILDMIMEPGIDGLDTYKRILDSHPGQKALIASGFSETDRVKEAQKLGAGRYLRKPYTLEKMGLAVKMELDR